MMGIRMGFSQIVYKKEKSITISYSAKAGKKISHYFCDPHPEGWSNYKHNKFLQIIFPRIPDHIKPFRFVHRYALRYQQPVVRLPIQTQTRLNIDLDFQT